jgi:hypothetical protein
MQFDPNTVQCHPEAICEADAARRRLHERIEMLEEQMNVATMSNLEDAIQRLRSELSVRLDEQLKLISTDGDRIRVHELLLAHQRDGAHSFTEGHEMSAEEYMAEIKRLKTVVELNTTTINAQRKTVKAQAVRLNRATLFFSNLQAMLECNLNYVGLTKQLRQAIYDFKSE